LGARGSESERAAGAWLARDRGPLHGDLPVALHRGDARLGERAAAPRRSVQAMSWIAVLEHLPALPETILLLGTCVLMLVDTFVKDERRAPTYWIAQGTLALCFAATLFVIAFSDLKVIDDRMQVAKYYIFNGLFVADFLSHLVKLVSYAAVSAALVYSRQWLVDRGLLRGEFFSLLLFSLLGMMLLASANSFITVYLGLELMSLCLYALVALNRDSARSPRACSSTACR